MGKPMDPIRLEHTNLRPHFDTIRALADHLDTAAPATVTEGLTGALQFLDDALIPHALAEDAVLYPAVASAMGSDKATATMSRDHLEVVRLTEQLRYLAQTQRGRQKLTNNLRRDLQRVLYSIDAIVRLHLDKEEEVYLPLLDDHLSGEDAATVLASLHAAAHSAAARRVS